MKKWFNIVLLPLLIGITFYLLLKGQDLTEIWHVFCNVSLTYVALAILAMTLYLGLEAAMLHVLININQKIRPPVEAIKSMFIGQFYSLITPFASGGQPMQLYVMVKDGVKGSLATAVLVNKFLYFQVGVTIYSLVLFLFNWDAMLVYFAQTKGLIGIGLLFNAVGLALLILAVFRPNLIKKLINLIVFIMQKIGVRAQRAEQIKVKYYHEVDDYAISTKMLFTHPRVIIWLSIMTFIQLTAYFGITYFIYRAFGHYTKSAIEIIALQAILYMSISLIPAPGSAGVAEGGFFMVFSALFPAHQITSAVLVWRGITYYLNLVISGIATIAVTIGLTLKERMPAKHKTIGYKE